MRALGTSLALFYSCWKVGEGILRWGMYFFRSCPLSMSHCHFYPEGFQSERGGKILLMLNPQNLFGICNPPETAWSLPTKSKLWEPRSQTTVHTVFPSSLRPLHTSSPETEIKKGFIWTSWEVWENWSFFHPTNAMGYSKKFYNNFTKL